MAEIRRPPITRLNCDILLLIFKINADMFSDDKALETTRLSSQVCQEWRDTILERPSFWGHLIDLDTLTQVKDEWRKEVLRRSAQSPLSIKSQQALIRRSFMASPDGHVWAQPKTTPWETYFISLLTDNWNRIERLTVKIGTHISIPLEFLCSPAPQLRIFEVDSPTIQNQHDLSLFGNYAPLLHTFRAIDLAFKLSASWLQSLRTIEIGPRFPISFVLDIMKRMPLLENVIYSGGYTSGQNIAGTASLTLGPSVRNLEISGGLNSCLDFLGCIIPRDDYTLQVYTSLIEPGISLDRLSLYTERHFKVHVPTQISLDLSRKFQLTTLKARGPKFSLSILCSDASGRTGPLGILVTLPMPVFRLVTELDLIVPHFLQDKAKLPMVAFLRLLPGLKVLHIEEFMCSYIVDVQKHSSDVLLPSLNTLQVDAISKNVLDFLLMRSGFGHPISVLDLKKCQRPGVLMIAPENLQNFAALQILWA